MSYSPLTSKLFKFTALSLALALAGCGGDGVDSIAPSIDGSGGNNNGGNNGSGDGDSGEQVPDVEPDFFLQNLTVSPKNIELSDEETVFTVTVKAVQKVSGGAVINKNVSLKVNNSESNGITIEGQSTQTTDSEGNAVYKLKLNPQAVTDKAALLANGFTLVATAEKAGGGEPAMQQLRVSVSAQGSGDGSQVVVSQLDVEPVLQTGSVSNNVLNALGDTATLSVIIKNKEGALVEGVTIGLGIASNKGISITGGNSKKTASNGMASFGIKLDSSLTEIERNKLIQQGVTYVINVKENNGATKSKTATLPVALPTSDYNLIIAGSSELLNAYGDTQQLTITAAPKNTKVPTQINGAKVSAKLNNAVNGVSLANENITLDAKGQANVALNIAPELDSATRTKLAKDGVSYTLVLTEPNGSNTTKTFRQSVYIPAQKYQINFNSSDKKQLSSSGGTAVVSFRVNNLNGGVIAGQQVTVKLPSDLIAAGLLTLESDSKQTTDAKGEVSYNVRVPNNLTAAQKIALENAKPFVLTANIKEPLGITSEATSERIVIGSDIGVSDIILTASGVPAIVNILDEQFKLQVFGKRKDGSAANNRPVKLIINSGSGITIRGNSQTTNASGVAEFTLDINQNMTQAQRDALIDSGINYTAILTDNDGTQSKVTQTIKVASPATNIQFASIATPIISELGGKGSINVKLTSKNAPIKPIERQTVAIQLGSTALNYGVTVDQTTATTDFNGETIFVVNIPETLTAEQRAELKRTGINYQLSYVENGVTYKSATQKVTITTPLVKLDILNALNNIDNQAGYILNQVGSTANIKAQLSNQSSGDQIANQPIKLIFDNKQLASSLTVNGQIGSADISANTDANGTVDFNVVVPNNLTAKQKQAFNNQILTAMLTETLTGKQQQVKVKVQAMTASISLIANPTKALNLNGGEVQIEVTAADSDKNSVANQKVFLALPAAITSQGVTLVSGGSQTTDNSGKAIFTIAVPNNLTAEQKRAIGSSFAIVLSAADASSNIVTKTSQVNTVTPTGTTESITIGANKVVNTNGDTFKVFVRVTENDNSIANREVRLNVDDPIKTGVTVTNGTATTNSDGVATFNLKLESGANVNQAALEAGIKLIANTTTTENVKLEQNYIVAVDKTTIDSYQILATSDKSTLNTGGDQTNATFRVTDSSGGILVGVPVQLSIENLEASGAALTTPSVVTTDANGKVDVGILLAANTVNARLNHSVVINAKIVTPTYDASGNISMQVREEKSLSLSAVGTEITLVAAETQIKDGEATIVTTTLVDGAGRAIANAGMELVNADGTVIGNSTTITNADGKAIFTLNEADLTFDDNGNLRVFARALGEASLVTQRSTSSIVLIKVSQAGISFINIVDVYDVNVSQNINVQIRTNTPAQAAALIGKSVEVQTTIGTFINNDVIRTKTIEASNVNGNIITIPVVLTSRLAGTAVLEAKVLGVFASGNSGALKYQTTVDTRFRATTPAKMLFQAVKSVITPGTSTEVVATVKDKNDVPVEGQTVVFSRAADSSAGRLSAATAVTNRQGEARVVYLANASSPIGGVEINARLLNNSNSIGTKTTKITVSEEAVYTTLAFSNVVASDTIYYTKRGSISVMDGSGRAVANQEVSIKSYATEYAQGRVCLLDSTVSYQAADVLERDENGNVIKTTTPETQVKSETTPIFLQSGWIPTEDANYNYTLDKDNDPLLNEDKNNNNRLDAINPVAIIGGTVSDDNYTFITDAEGRADFEIRYPLRYSNWVKVRFDASTFLNGSENIQSINYTLPSADSDLVINNTSLETPWLDNASPFGTDGATCVDSMDIKVDDQNNMTQVILSPYQPSQPNYFVAIDGVNSSSSSIGYNSFIVDFDQAFDTGFRVNVSRNGFGFSKTITFK